MFEKLVSNLENGASEIASVILNKGYFLALLGSIFLLGIVSKCIVVWNFNRMIKKADDMDSPKNSTLRQIKLKFESIKTVNGTVANPMLLVMRYINKCKWGVFSLQSMNKFTGWCGLLCVGIGGASGFILYNQGYGKTTAMSYILVGFYFALALFVVEQSVRTKEKQIELVYIITDFFENSVNLREQMKMKDYDYEIKIDDNNLEEENVKENSDTTREQEKIINEVLAEYLQ